MAAVVTGQTRIMEGLDSLLLLSTLDGGRRWRWVGLISERGNFRGSSSSSIHTGEQKREREREGELGHELLYA